MKPRFNWNAVRAAMKRARYGNATAADQLLFERAWGTDPAQYRKLHAEVGSVEKCDGCCSHFAKKEPA
jgi:hypothetical protein